MGIDALCLMHGRDQYRLYKKCTMTCYTKLVLLRLVGSAVHVGHSMCPGCEMLMHYFSWSGGLGAVSIKSASGHVTPNL
jgi:hypothetical protein